MWDYADPAYGGLFPQGDRSAPGSLSYEPSQQNTNTGRLTPAMLRDVLIHARALAAA